METCQRRGRRGLVAQRGARQRTDDAIHRQTPARLEGAHRFFGFFSEDPVDFDGPQGLLQKLYLPAFAARAEQDRVFGGRRRLVLPLARLAVGPTVSATSAPSETRFARELAGTNRSSAARRRARERPNESCQGCSSARSRAACRLRVSSSAESEQGETSLADSRSLIGRVRDRPRLTMDRAAR